MNAFRQTRRMLAMLLVLAMILSVLPLNVFAASGSGAVDAAIIFSDLHTNKNDYKESTVKGIMGALKNTGLSFSSVVSAGDAFSVNEDSGRYTGYPSTITGYIRDALGNSGVPVYYVWSDHDRYAEGINKNSGFIYGAGADGIYGTSDDGNYYIYSLSMADLSTNDRYSAGFSSNAAVTATIAKFVADAAKLDQSKPLFIASHQPLFDRRNDNGHALEWCTAINQVAENMDVAFFFGHNHRYDQAGDYYYAKGSTMAVTKPDYSSQNVKLNFTHMCAGYMAPSSTGSTSNTTRQGVAVAIVIYEDSIRYTTYNSGGVYSGSYALNQTVTRDFAVAEPELVVSGTKSYFVGDALDVTVSYKTGSRVQDVTAEAVMTGWDMNTAGDQTIAISYGGLSAQFPIQVREKVFYDAATGITLEENVPGATKLTVSVLGSDSDAFRAASGLLGSCAGYEINLENHAGGTASAVTMPVPAGVTTPAVYRYSDGILTKLDVEVSGEGTTVTFGTDCFGAFLIGQEEISEDLEGSVVGGGTSYEEQTVYVRVDQFEDGGKYLVIGEDKVSDGNPIAYLNNSGSEGWEKVAINTAPITVGSTTYSNGYIESANANGIWTASGSASSGFTLSNNGRYIGGTDANTLKSSSSQAVKVLYDASAVRLKTASGTTRYLYYSTYGSENWKWTTSANSSTSSRKMWIYKEVTVQVATSAPVTYTLEAADLHHVLTADTAQLNYTLLADGAAAALPEGGSFRFEVKNDGNGIIAAISDQGLITFNNVAGSCYVKISFTWSEGSVYKYVKVTTEADPNACSHSYVSETEEATCTEAGSVTYTCAICGESYAEEIPSVGHTYESVVTAPTCTEAGFTTNICACGDRYVSSEVAALGHSYDAVMEEPTCTEAGSVTYTCACGDSYAESIPALGHKYEAAVTAPTCTEAGYTTHTCPCGDSYVSDEVAALGHNYETVTMEATCTEGGYTAHTCSICNDGYVSDEIAALGHNYETVTVEASCVAGGYTSHTCVRCGDGYVTGEVAALGHDYDCVITEADCDEAGSKVYTCVRCDDSYTEVIPALGHDFESVVTAPTCTSGGYTTNICTTCGERTISDEVAALGHSYEAETVETTCTESGSVTYTCACGDSYVESIPALGHQYESVVTVPTCTEDGYTTNTCVCGDSYISDEVAALGHQYESVVTAPTCTEDGYTTNTCVCGDSYISDEVAALGHKYESVVAAPTCTEDGYTTNTCVCGDCYISDEVAALGHNYVCTETANSLVYTCSGCGDSYTESLSHSYTKVTAFAVDHNYVITLVSGNKYYALSHKNNTISAVQVTVSNNQITSEITEDLVWNYSNSKLSYESNGTTYYLYAQPANNWWGGWWNWWSTPTLAISSTNSTTVSLSSNKVKLDSYYLRYSSGTISLNSSGTTANLFVEE